MEITDLVPSAYYIPGAGPEDPAKRRGQSAGEARQAEYRLFV